MPETHLQRILRRLAEPFHTDGGQALAEACIVIPVLLMLFLGLWHHSLAQLTQTRTHLAARHVAWARASLNKSSSDAKKYANAFFPTGTKLDVKVEEATSYTDYANNLVSLCTALTMPKNNRPGQVKAKVAATVPALPFAPPKSPGQYGAKTYDSAFLGAVKTREVQVVWNAAEEQPANYTLPLLGFMVSRPELLLEWGISIAIGESYAKLLKVIGDLVGESGWFGEIMEKLHLDFMGDLFGAMVETFLWLVNDIYELITGLFE